MKYLEATLTKFNEIINNGKCNALAKRCELVKRSSSRLQGYEFAQAMMLPNGFIESETLNSLATRMHKINKNCNLSASALAQRINSPAAENFMKACFEETLREIVKKEFDNESLKLEIFSSFKRVLIQDSTRAELNEKLSSTFKGTGGAASKASLKIDFIFDYLSEESVDVSFCAGSKPDQSLAKRIINFLREDDLLIRDLGYFSVGNLIEVEKKGASHISRWKVNEDVYESREAKEPVDLAKYIRKNMFNGIFDKEMFVGKQRHCVRMVACEVSEGVVNKRLRDANRDAKRRGTKMSAKKEGLLKLSIFVTNVPVKILSGEVVMALYRVRWRIELIFKQWKSCMNLHVFKGYNTHRIHCLLYARLVMLLLIGKIYPILMKYALDRGRELSSYKLTNYLLADHNFANALQSGRMDRFIDQLLTDILRRLCMDKRKRQSLRSSAKMGKGYDNKLTMNDLQKNAA